MRNRTSDLLNSLASSKLTIPTISFYIDLVFSFSETVSLWEHLYSAIQIYDFDWLSFVVFALHERIARLASSYVLIAILSGRESTFFPSNGRLSTCYLLWSVIKIIIRKADVPSQIVIFSLFHNFYQTIMMSHRSVKTLRKKKNKISTKSFVISHCRYRRRVVCSNSVQAWMMFSSFSQLLRFCFQLQLNDICLQVSLFRNSNI